MRTLFCRTLSHVFIVGCCVFAATSADAQDQPESPPQLEVAPIQSGRVAESAVGQVGQRRTAGMDGNIVPMGRIDSRIQNRIQSRLQTRIDRDYNPQFNTSTPFGAAEDRTRATGRSRQR